MDLVVGAPHFFERKEEIGGAVYVYINPGGHWDSATPLRLNGTCGSMFGIALSAAGDLNHDGFEGEGPGGPGEGSPWAGTQPTSCRGGRWSHQEAASYRGSWEVEWTPPHTPALAPPTHTCSCPPQTWRWGPPSTAPARSTSTTAAAWALW